MTMGPLLFVNWRSVNTMFCAMMWVVAIVLVALILSHATSSSAAMVHHVRTVGAAR